jgi:hypothetical protein
MTAVAVMTTVELLSFSPQALRADNLFASLVTTSKGRVEIVRRSQYRGGSDLLMLWGPGHPSRFEPMRKQIAAGGHVVCFDLSYFDRHRKVRVSIDAAHPQAYVMRKDRPDTRWRAEGLRTENVWNPDGPVIVAGIGDKAKLQYGSMVDTWERDQIAACKARGWKVQYRPKKRDGSGPPGIFVASSAVPIETALRGASLVMTWHSNVAVDAIRMGIPVVCRDGAAAAVCPSALPPAGQVPPLSAALRDRFLANLCWFQWVPDEPGFWPFLAELLA